MFTRSSRFEKMCRTTFSQFDFDNSGSLDTTEVYAAVLSLYTKILLYVTTARVPSHEEVKRVSDDIDYDKVSSYSTPVSIQEWPERANKGRMRVCAHVWGPLNKP